MELMNKTIENIIKKLEEQFTFDFNNKKESFLRVGIVYY